ncbi:MAG: oxygen-independent coproporphyrinogen III oxidase [Chlamydiae bacterium]|nr:oxygen-independent coproporphyrinogen III oxidase [Chlamydiota bacterium]
MVLKEIDPALLASLDLPAPRYTSYPTAPAWYNIEEEVYLKALQQFDESSAPLSLYVHIPFCKTMCLFCGCSVILNRREDVQDQYVDSLLEEARLIIFRNKHPLRQLHLGGGTPTQLTEDQLKRLYRGLIDIFPLDTTAEISIEVDPRNGTNKLELLKDLGFNRISFGVQDTDPSVQKAIHRYQSYEMTRDTMLKARALNFDSINMDLIYGLPLQTVESFKDTINKIIEMSPDRIALFSYAKIPWIKAHQKAIPEESLPSTPIKFALYAHARKVLIEAGYLPIGMDHFAKKEDELTLAFQEKRLQRNFQGYSLKNTENMLGLGVTSIGYISGVYIQNAKDLISYNALIKKRRLPVQKGFVLGSEDFLRRSLIQKLMCDFEIDKEIFKKEWGKDFDALFQIDSELVINNEKVFKATPIGALFIRNIAMYFDAYINKGNFSKAI